MLSPPMPPPPQQAEHRHLRQGWRRHRDGEEDAERALRCQGCDEDRAHHHELRHGLRWPHGRLPRARAPQPQALADLQAHLRREPAHLSARQGDGPGGAGIHAERRRAPLRRERARGRLRRGGAAPLPDRPQRGLHRLEGDRHRQGRPERQVGPGAPRHGGHLLRRHDAGRCHPPRPADAAHGHGGGDDQDEHPGGRGGRDHQGVPHPQRGRGAGLPGGGPVRPLSRAR
mmetsp:Transcript_33546/g.105987  ORF Transcript_33546/g.105987 Transcript_33546/m.105987 type:complete len:229 (+) Transcript_33546:386-1072(+)